MESKKTLIDIDRQIWAKVRYFATKNDMTLSEATNYLLGIALLDSVVEIPNK